jgi:acetyl-CoA carboxylase, biotin carboxylase subunit
MFARTSGSAREAGANPAELPIEVRVNAEDPARDFMPMPGRVERFRPPLGPGVRVDTFVEDGAFVPPHYDSLLAKVIAWAPDRDLALARCLRALNEFEVTGLPTTIGAAAEVIRSEAFARGEYSTSYLEDNPPLVPSNGLLLGSERP